MGTTDTFPGDVLQLGSREMRLRVVAPFAAHVATLQKHGGTDSRSIVDAQSLYAGDEPFHTVVPESAINFSCLRQKTAA